MEELPAFGTAISDVAPKTFAVYSPLLCQNARLIRSTRKETASYGKDPRQFLDVYYPSRILDDSPLMIFCYGGGLVRGEKSLPSYADGLTYANMGHFYAERLGYITVIPDYRLESHGAKFPSGGEDLALTIQWVRDNLIGVGKSKDLYLMGNSAGGIHLSTFLFSAEFQQLRETILPGSITPSLVLRGAILLSVPFHFRKAVPSRASTLSGYFGDVDKFCPLGLLISATGEQEANPLPRVRILVLNGDLDPEDEILEPRRDFIEAWRAYGNTEMQRALTVETMEGHNHISPVLSLGTNDEKEEAWGYQTEKWISSFRSTNT